MIILSSFKVTSTIYLFYNLCRFVLELSTNILIMIILSSFKVTSTIYLFYNLCRFVLELSTNILTMTFLSSFKVTSTIYLFYNLWGLPLLHWLALNRSLLIMIQSALKVIFTFYFTIFTFFVPGILSTICRYNQLYWKRVYNLYILVLGVLSTKIFPITFSYLLV